MLRNPDNLNKLKNLVERDCGQGLMEYALIVGLISVASILIMTPLGARILTLFEKIASAMLAVIT